MSAWPADQGAWVDPLSVRMIKNGVLNPTIRVASHPGKLLMGVCDEDHTYVAGTALDRRSGEQGAPVPRDLFPPAADSDAPEAIYAGPLYFHFGHFLLESLSRAWYAQQHPDVPFAWAGQHNWQGMELRSWQLEILDVLQITNPPWIIADPTRFDLLHVPDIGYRYDDRFHPEHAEFLGQYEGPAQVPGQRLWVSRSMVESEVGDVNAGATERRLAEAGWRIAHPESLGIREQLDRLSRAEIVAGEEGSAFHLLILLKDVRAKRFHILRRQGREHNNMHTIADARGVNQSFHTVEREVVLRAEGRVVSKITPNSSEILDLLEVPVPTAVSDGLESADAALQEILAAFAPRRFLDVGATSPHLVLGSTASTRVAVSLRFSFDPRTWAASGVDFYELGLTQYADLFHEDRGRFDVIRITGSTFDEIIEAFRVSKRLAHNNTRWILGSGDLAARAGLAIRLIHAGFTVRRLFVNRKFVYFAERRPGEPSNAAGVEKMSAKEVRRRMRGVRPTSLDAIRRRATATRA